MTSTLTMNPAIVIPAFNRLTTLESLLQSLEAADIPGGTPLVISVDLAIEDRHQEGNKSVTALARRYQWRHGPYDVIMQPEHLGLVGNVFFCSAMADQFGAVILLEDDLRISRQLYNYAQLALEYYRDDSRLAGISLNALWFNGFTNQPFIPLLDDGDVFFLQLSTPQGQVYTAAQWADFTGWLASQEPHVSVADQVHELFSRFPPDDWLALKAKYLVDSNRYYVYPRESLTTCLGDPGTHFYRRTAIFGVPLQHFRRDFRFQSFDSSVSVYDGFYELLPERLNRLSDQFRDLSYDVDLYASKSAHHLQSEFTLTTRRCRESLVTFGKQLRPLEANVIDGFTGAGITLARREDVDTGQASTRQAQRDNDRYFARRDDAKNNGTFRSMVTGARRAIKKVRATQR